MLNLSHMNIRGFSIKVISIIFIFFLIIFGLYKLYLYQASNKVKSINETIVQVSYVAQGFADLNGHFNFDKNNFLNIMNNHEAVKDNKNLSIHEIDVGISTLGKKQNADFYITVKGIDAKDCKELVVMLKDNFDVIAVGENISQNVGLNTGMYIENIYGNRKFDLNFANETCNKEALRNGKVNITTWIGKDKKLTLSGASVDEYNHLKK